MKIVYTPGAEREITKENNSTVEYINENNLFTYEANYFFLDKYLHLRQKTDKHVCQTPFKVCKYYISKEKLKILPFKDLKTYKTESIISHTGQINKCINVNKIYKPEFQIMLQHPQIKCIEYVDWFSLIPNLT